MNLINKLSIAGMVLGAGLALKGCNEDFNYETEMIRANKTEVFEEKGAFKDRNNCYEFAGGLFLFLGAAYALGYGKKPKTENYEAK